MVSDRVIAIWRQKAKQGDSEAANRLIEHSKDKVNRITKSENRDQTLQLISLRIDKATLKLLDDYFLILYKDKPTRSHRSRIFRQAISEWLQNKLDNLPKISDMSGCVKC